MSKLTNRHNIPISMAAWLAHDTYTNQAEKHPDHITVSATSLLKSTRQMVLAQRVLNAKDKAPVDVNELIASRVGTSIHDTVENFWTGPATNWKKALRALGYTEVQIQRIMVNPDDSDLSDAIDALYIEQRNFKIVGDYVISGCFDFLFNGELTDFKTTGTYSWNSDSKAEAYSLQASIYRWLNPEKVTSDYVNIVFMFTDYQKHRAATDPNYPPCKIMRRRYELMSIEDTQAFVEHKLALLDINKDVKEADLPACTSEELWKPDSKYRFYNDKGRIANPMAKATKIYYDLKEVEQAKAKTPGSDYTTEEFEPRACAFCEAYALCNQSNKGTRL